MLGRDFVLQDGTNLKRKPLRARGRRKGMEKRDDQNRVNGKKIKLGFIANWAKAPRSAAAPDKTQDFGRLEQGSRELEM